MPGERWHKEELEALKWILDRKEERRVEAFRHGAVWEADKWSWDVVAHKMTRVAARDGWPYYRDYTGKVCYTAYRKRKALMADTGPGSSIPTAQEYEQSTASMVHPSQLLDQTAAQGNRMNLLPSYLPAPVAAPIAPVIDLNYHNPYGFAKPKAPSSSPALVSAPTPSVNTREHYNLYGFSQLDTPPPQATSIATLYHSTQQGTPNVSRPLSSHSGGPVTRSEQRRRLPDGPQPYTAPSANPYQQSTGATSMLYHGPAASAPASTMYPGFAPPASSALPSPIPSEFTTVSARFFGPPAASIPAPGSGVWQSQTGVVTAPEGSYWCPPEPPYHWTPMERDALKEVYLFSGIGQPSNLVPGRRRGRWTWKMVAEEMNRRSVGASWNVGRRYNEGSCHQMTKYNKEEWDEEQDLDGNE